MPPVLPVTVPSCAKYAEDDSVSRIPPPEFPVTTNWPPNLALESRLTITPRSAFPVIWQPSQRSIPLCVVKIPLPLFAIVEPVSKTNDCPSMSIPRPLFTIITSVTRALLPWLTFIPGPPLPRTVPPITTDLDNSSTATPTPAAFWTVLPFSRQSDPSEQLIPLPPPLIVKLLIDTLRESRT